MNITQAANNQGSPFVASAMLIIGVTIAIVVLILMTIMGDWVFREIERDIGESSSPFYILIPIVGLILVGVVLMLIVNHRMSKEKQEKEYSGNTINYRPLEPSRSGKE